MSKFATKAAANMFCQARYEAAKSNERLSSREGAAEEIGIDRTRLARIELGSTIPFQMYIMKIYLSLPFSYEVILYGGKVFLMETFHWTERESSILGIRWKLLSGIGCLSAIRRLLKRNSVFHCLI